MAKLGTDDYPYKFATSDLDCKTHSEASDVKVKTLKLQLHTRMASISLKRPAYRGKSKGPLFVERSERGRAMHPGEVLCAQSSLVKVYAGRP